MPSGNRWACDETSSCVGRQSRTDSAVLGIGREILERQAREGWGSRVIDRLSADLRRDFLDMTGLSARDLNHSGGPGNHEDRGGRKFTQADTHSLSLTSAILLLSIGQN